MFSKVIVPSAFDFAVATGVFKFSAVYRLKVNSSAFGSLSVRPSTTFLAVTLNTAGIGSSLRLIAEPAAPSLTVYSFSSNL